MSATARYVRRMDLPLRPFIVAAHPDDDAIGCGGTIARIARAGGEVAVVYATDGGGSHPRSRSHPPATVARLRRREALSSLHILGVAREPTFLGLPDGQLGALTPDLRREAVERLASVLAAFAPDAVFAPWIRDPHPDHVAAAALTLAALGSARPQLALTTYEVWLPVRGTLADVPQPGEARTFEVALDAATLACKRAAILAHATQTTDLIADDPNGFSIDAALLDRWLRPFERFHTLHSTGS